MSLSDKALRRIADVTKDKSPSEEEMIKFFKENPDPDDDVLHAWAEENGYDPHEVEEVVYLLVTKYVKNLGDK